MIHGKMPLRPNFFVPQTVRFVNNGLSKPHTLCVCYPPSSCNNHIQTSSLGHTGTLMPCLDIRPWESSQEESQRVAYKDIPGGSGHSACRRAPPWPAPETQRPRSQPRGQATQPGAAGPRRCFCLPLPVTFVWVTSLQAPSGTSPTIRQPPLSPSSPSPDVFLALFALPAKLWQPQQFLRKAETAGRRRAIL